MRSLPLLLRPRTGRSQEKCFASHPYAAHKEVPKLQGLIVEGRAAPALSRRREPFASRGVKAVRGPRGIGVGWDLAVGVAKGAGAGLLKWGAYSPRSGPLISRDGCASRAFVFG